MTPRSVSSSRRCRPTIFAPAALPVLLAAASAWATDANPTLIGQRFATWDNTYATTFPVIHVDSCSNNYIANFTQPWSNILSNATSAMNEWFVEGGVNLRLRYNVDLPANDARCTTGTPTPANGEILLTAVPSDGGGGWLGLTVWNVDTNNKMKSAYIKLAANYTWAANADYPAWNANPCQNDFWSVFLHEFGHSIGFNHTTDATAVMNTNRPKCGDVVTRHLSQNEMLGLRSVYPLVPAYGPTTTTAIHYNSINNGSVWTLQTEPFPLSQVGSASVATANQDKCFDGVTQCPFLVGVTSASTDNMQTYISNGGSTHWGPGYTSAQPVPSYHGPAVAFGNGWYVAAAAGQDPYAGGATTGETINYVRSSDAETWTYSASTGKSSYFEPTLAYAGFKSWFILAWADRDRSYIHTMLSKDNGQTFVNEQAFDHSSTVMRTSTPFGIACDTTSSCFIAYADDNGHSTLMTTAQLKFDSNGNLFVNVAPSPLVNAGSNFASYGGTVAWNGSRWQYVWRDRGTATVLTSAGGTSPPTVDTLDFTGVISHSPPAILWDSSSSLWWMWSSFSNPYND